MNSRREFLLAGAGLAAVAAGGCASAKCGCECGPAPVAGKGRCPFRLGVAGYTLYRYKNLEEALALLKSKGLTVRQLERLTGINRGVIQKAKSCQQEPSLLIPRRFFYGKYEL